MGAPDTESPYQQYLASLERRLGQRGYEPRRDGPQEYRASVFHDRSVELTKFGLIDHFVVVAQFESLTPDAATQVSRAAYRYGLGNKSPLPRGLGGGLVVYPVIAMPSVPPDVRDWVGSYANKHWGAFEFPVVVDLSAWESYYNTSKPLWGRAYYSGFQSMAEESLSPPASAQTVSQQRAQGRQPAGDQQSAQGRQPQAQGHQPQGQQPQHNQQQGHQPQHNQQQGQQPQGHQPQHNQQQGHQPQHNQPQHNQPQHNQQQGHQPEVCPNCGAHVASDWQQCQSCGAAL